MTVRKIQNSRNEKIKSLKAERNNFLRIVMQKNVGNCIIKLTICLKTMAGIKEKDTAKKGERQPRSERNAIICI